MWHTERWRGVDTNEEIEDLTRKVEELLSRGRQLTPEEASHYARLETGVIRGTTTEEDLQEYERLKAEYGFTPEAEMAESEELQRLLANVHRRDWWLIMWPSDRIKGS